jgi:predicted O-methyltransferase YrrM
MLLKMLGLHPYWCAARSDYLKRCGFIRSNAERRAVDADGEAIPWLPYPVVDFLKSLDLSSSTVFEYGSGASTVFFAKRAKRLLSCEHDPQWSAKVNSSLSAPNATLVLREDKEAYKAEILRYKGEIDVAFIDGIEREACAANALSALSPGGVLILDDTFRPEYEPVFKMMTERGFRHISISGPTPIFLNFTKTTIFYRDGNCFGL